MWDILSIPGEYGGSFEPGGFATSPVNASVCLMMKHHVPDKLVVVYPDFLTADRETPGCVERKTPQHSGNPAYEKNSPENM